MEFAEAFFWEQFGRLVDAPFVRLWYHRTCSYRFIRLHMTFLHEFSIDQKNIGQRRKHS